MKKKALFTSILTIALCLSLIAGSTFALFTSESSVNIAVTAGKVSVEASIELISLYSPTKIGTDGTVTDDTNAANNSTDPKTFALSGTATLDENKLTLANVTPGDKALFKIKIANNSNVAAKYRTVITVVDDDGLAEALEFDIGGEKAVGETEWNALTDDVSLDCYVMLPTTAGNGYKNKTCTVSFTVEAVQGNTQTRNYGIKWSGAAATAEQLAAVTDTEAKTVKISTPELLAALAASVNGGNSYRDYTITLEADMDLCNINWTPIGSSEHPFDARVFDGQGHTINNLKVNGGAAAPTDLEATDQGLFGYTWTNGNIIEIMNLNIHNVDIYAKNSAGAVVGQVMTDQSAYWLAGYTAIHHVNLTGKVTIEGGNSGGLSGSGTGGWALQTQYSDIVIDVDAGSYVSNVKAKELSGDGVGGALGSVAPIVAWGRVVNNIQSNLDVIGVAGNVGGVIGIGNQYFENITYTGNVTVKNVAPKENGKYDYALVTGIITPTWNHSEITETRRNSISATGTLTIELTDGQTVTSNGYDSNNFGGWAW